MEIPASTVEGTVQAFFEKYSAAVLRLCRKLSATEEDAEDARQDAFLQLQKHWSRLDPASNPVGWLFRTAAHAALKTRRHPGPPDSKVEDLLEAPPVLAAENRERIASGLRALPEEYRRLIRYRFHEGRNPAEIARRLGIPPGRVRVQLCRGLRLLREIVKGMS